MTDGTAGGVSNAQAFAYEGEDTGMTVQFPDGSRRWIRAGEYEFDDYTEGFGPSKGQCAVYVCTLDELTAD